LRVNRAAGGAETKYQVAQVIRRDAAHPPPGAIGLIGGFLGARPVSPIRAVHFEPSNPRHGVGTDGVVVEQRFATAGEHAIGVPEHQPIGHGVQIGG